MVDAMSNSTSAIKSFFIVMLFLSFYFAVYVFICLQTRDISAELRFADFLDGSDKIRFYPKFAFRLGIFFNRPTRLLIKEDISDIAAAAPYSDFLRYPPFPVLDKTKRGS